MVRESGTRERERSWTTTTTTTMTKRGGHQGKVEGGSWATGGEKEAREAGSRWKNGAGRVITKYKGWAGPRHRARQAD